MTGEEKARVVDKLRQVKAGFETAYANEALREYLMEFCHAKATCFNADARLHARAEGRRDVWLELQTFHDHSIEGLLAIYLKKIGDDNA